MIISTALITQTGDSDLFYKRLNQTITEYQEEGLTVEIQYSTTANFKSLTYSALIIARDGITSMKLN